MAYKFNPLSGKLDIVVDDHTKLSNIGTNTHPQIDTHLASTSNPHSVTLAQVGGTTNHTLLSNIGTLTHANIDSIIETANPVKTTSSPTFAGETIGSLLINSNVVAANSYQRFTMGAGISWNTANANYTVNDPTYTQSSFSDENGVLTWTLHSGALSSPQTYAQWHAFDRMKLSTAGLEVNHIINLAGGNDKGGTAGSGVQIAGLGNNWGLDYLAFAARTTNQGIAVEFAPNGTPTGFQYAFTFSATAYGSMLAICGNAGDYKHVIAASNDASSGTAWDLVFRAAANNANWSAAPNAVTIKAGAPVDMLYLNASGNVGIGTASPDYKLQVNGVIAPETDGQDLGVTSTLRWDAYIKVLAHEGTTAGFFGTAPTTKPTALTVADASALNTGDATSDTVIANMRTRIGELESKLQSLGLIT